MPATHYPPQRRTARHPWLEEGFRQLADIAREGIWVLDDDAFIVFANPRLAEMLEYADKEMLNCPVYRFLYPTDHTVMQKAVEHSRREMTMSYRLCLHRQYGPPCDVVLTAAPFRDARAQLIGTLCTVQESVRAPAINGLVTGIHDMLGAAVNCLPIPVLLFSPAREVIFANTASWIFFNASELSQWQSIRFCHPETRQAISLDTLLDELIAQHKSTECREMVAQLPDGREVLVLLHLAPVTRRDKLIAISMLVQDIADFKAVDRAKNDFLAIISHELLTPLTCILGWAQQAQLSKELHPRALEIIERNARRQQRILTDLLDMTKLLHGKMFLSMALIDLCREVTACIDEEAVVMEESGITLVRHVASQGLTVVVDGARIQQAIRHLLANARRFTPAGGTVTVTVERKRDRAVVSVTDTGRGMTAEDLAMLFQPFRQVGRREDLGGLGLGLALAKGIVELHGGEMSASSAGPGQGSTFTLSLPLFARGRGMLVK